MVSDEEQGGADDGGRGSLCGLRLESKGEHWHSVSTMCTDYFRPFHLPNSTLGASPSLWPRACLCTTWRGLLAMRFAGELHLLLPMQRYILGAAAQHL